MPDICPKCGHHWDKHDAKYFMVCTGNHPDYPGKLCGCEYTKEQAERAIQQGGSRG